VDTAEKSISPQNLVFKEKSGFLTHRGIDDLAEGFGRTREELLTWVGSKQKILDISSGGARLKQEIEILRAQGQFTAPTEIISFDIGYALPSGIAETQYATHLAYDSTGQPYTGKQIKETHVQFKKTAVAGSFRNLPFPDGTFDGIIAANSFGISVLDKEQLVAAYKEVHRVLNKEHGDGLITVVTDPEHENGLRIQSDTDTFAYSLDEIADLHPSLKSATIAPAVGEPYTTHYLEVKP
jgi:hypothetical protein